MTVTPEHAVLMNVAKDAKATFEFKIDADRTTNWILTNIPSAWMKADATFGRTPATVTLTIDPVKMRAGNSYGVSLIFTNIRTHLGDTTRAFVLEVLPAGHAGWLICADDDNVSYQNPMAAFCLDGQGGRLIAQ